MAGRKDRLRPEGSVLNLPSSSGIDRTRCVDDWPEERDRAAEGRKETAFPPNVNFGVP